MHFAGLGDDHCGGGEGQHAGASELASARHVPHVADPPEEQGIKAVTCHSVEHLGAALRVAR